MPTDYGIQLGLGAGASLEWKWLKITTDQINALCPGPNNRPTKRVVYWSDRILGLFCSSRDSGVTVYNDGGFDFTTLGHGGTGLPQAWACAPSKPSTVYAWYYGSGTYPALYLAKSTDYGTTFVDLDNFPGQGLNLAVIGQLGARGIAVHPNLDQSIALVLSTGIIPTAYIYTSADGGLTWANQATLSSERGAGCVLMSKDDLFAATARGFGAPGYSRIYKNSNQVLQDDDWTYGYSTLATTPTTASRMLATGVMGGNHLWKALITFDGGEGWHDITPSDIVSATYMNGCLSLNGQTIYLAYMGTSDNGAGVYKSQDDGVTWEQIFSAGGSYVCYVQPDPVEDGWVWVSGSQATDTYIWLSKNYGQTWSAKRRIGTTAGPNNDSNLSIGYEVMVA